MSERQRNLLSVAAGPEAQGDKGWHAASTRRLYFENPNDINSAGMVDVHENGDIEPNYVRVELWIPTEVAAEVISHITGRESIAARVLVKDEIRRAQEAADAAKVIETAHGDGLDVPASALRLEREDDERSERLAREINETGGMGGADIDEVIEKDEDDEKAEIAALVAAQAEDDATTEIEPIEAIA